MPVFTFLLMSFAYHSDMILIKGANSNVSGFSLSMPLLTAIKRTLFRLNIFASNYRQQGWKIVVSNSYSANAGLAIEVATALYKAGAPLLIYDAEKFLRIMLEEDYVRLVPDSYHNYMGYQEEGAVYELPWEYECSDDSNSVLTKEQYQAIVSLAEWQQEERISIH